MVGATWLILRPPLPLIRFTTVLAEPVPVWYSLSAFPVLGMLLADLASILRSFGPTFPSFELGIQILVVLVLSNLRLGVQIPISGHVLLFSYFLLRRILLRAPENPIRHIEWIAAIVLFSVAAYAKLVWWDDPFTLLFGVFAGAFLVWVSWFLNKGKAAVNSGPRA